LSYLFRWHCNASQIINMRFGINCNVFHSPRQYCWNYRHGNLSVENNMLYLLCQTSLSESQLIIF